MKSFQEIVDVIKSADGDPTNLVPHHQDILEFIIEIDSAGCDIMKHKSDEYIGDLYAMVSTCALFIMISRGLCNPMQATMISGDKTMQSYAALILKLSIGMSAIEELR